MGITHPNTKKHNFLPEIGRDPGILMIFWPIFKILAGKKSQFFFSRKSPKIILKSFQPSKWLKMAPNDIFLPYICISHHVFQKCYSRYFSQKSIFCDFHKILMVTVLVTKMHKKVQKSCKIEKMYSWHPKDACE